MLPSSITEISDPSARIEALALYKANCSRRYELARAGQPSLGKLILEMFFFALGTVALFGSFAVSQTHVVTWVLIGASTATVVGALILIVFDIRSYERSQDQMAHWTAQIRACSEALQDLHRESAVSD